MALSVDGLFSFDKTTPEEVAQGYPVSSFEGKTQCETLKRRTGSEFLFDQWLEREQRHQYCLSGGVWLFAEP